MSQRPASILLPFASILGAVLSDPVATQEPTEGAASEVHSWIRVDPNADRGGLLRTDLLRAFTSPAVLDAWWKVMPFPAPPDASPELVEVFRQIGPSLERAAWIDVQIAGTDATDWFVMLRAGGLDDADQVAATIHTLATPENVEMVDGLRSERDGPSRGLFAEARGSTVGWAHTSPERTELAALHEALLTRTWPERSPAAVAAHFEPARFDLPIESLDLSCRAVDARFVLDVDVALAPAIATYLAPFSGRTLAEPIPRHLTPTVRHLSLAFDPLGLLALVDRAASTPDAPAPVSQALSHWSERSGEDLTVMLSDQLLGEIHLWDLLLTGFDPLEALRSGSRDAGAGMRDGGFAVLVPMRDPRRFVTRGLELVETLAPELPLMVSRHPDRPVVGFGPIAEARAADAGLWIAFGARATPVREWSDPGPVDPEELEDGPSLAARRPLLDGDWTATCYLEGPEPRPWLLRAARRYAEVLEPGTPTREAGQLFGRLIGEFVIHGVGSPLGGIRVKDDRIHLRWIL